MLKWFSKRKTSESSVKEQNQEPENLPEASSSSILSDADYEFLFNQLLDGVANGWNQLRIIKFFSNLGSRGEEAHWVAWLEKFSAKIPNVTNDSQRRLGAIMLRLAEVTQSAAELSQLSAISAQIGKKLFFGQTANLIWEYDGLDIVTPSTSVIDSTTNDEDSSIEENLTSISEPISESTEVTSSQLENIESSPAEESVATIPEASLEESSKLENIESPQPEKSTTAISESESVASPEIDSIEVNSSESQEPYSNQFNQLEDPGKHSLNPTEIEIVESWFNLGLKQANAGDFHGAIASWQKALELDPHLAEIWHNLGSALGRLEQYPEAIASFDRALAIDPQSYQAWNDRAHAFYQMEQWEQAVNSWDKAIAINPGNHQFWYHHGCALEQLQRLEEAISSYRKALEISPDFQPARSKYINLIPES